MWEVGGIAEIACIAGAGKGKNFEDASAHEGKKLHNRKNLLTPPTQAIVKSKLYLLALVLNKNLLSAAITSWLPSCDIYHFLYNIIKDNNFLFGSQIAEE